LLYLRKRLYSLSCEVKSKKLSKIKQIINFQIKKQFDNIFVQFFTKFAENS